MKKYWKRFTDSCLRSLAAIGQAELMKWGFNH